MASSAVQQPVGFSPGEREGRVARQDERVVAGQSASSQMLDQLPSLPRETGTPKFRLPNLEKISICWTLTQHTMISLSYLGFPVIPAKICKNIGEK